MSNPRAFLGVIPIWKHFLTKRFKNTLAYFGQDYKKRLMIIILFQSVFSSVKRASVIVSVIGPFIFFFLCSLCSHDHICQNVAILLA